VKDEIIQGKKDDFEAGKETSNVDRFPAGKDIHEVRLEDMAEETEYLKAEDYRPKVLITGAKGQLGYDLCNILAMDFNIIPTDLDELDITNPDDVVSNFTLHEPDIVIHAAAFTDVDGSESHQEEAFKINAMGTQNVALACQEFHSRMVYISTDYVFDGSLRIPLREYHKTNPLNVYGESKVLGEQIVQHLVMRHFILRTSWLFGTQGKNFPKTMLRLGMEKKEIGIIDDQWGCPTFSRDLAHAIAHLINSPFYGTYHVSNQGETTWCRFAQKIFELSGLDVKVKPLTTEEYPRPAKRPAWSVLDGFVWKVRGFPILRSWEKALEDFLEDPVVISEFPFLEKRARED
jgi:dTDP-4-dehydrorhamnose reductase